MANRQWSWVTSLGALVSELVGVRRKLRRKLRRERMRRRRLESELQAMQDIVVAYRATVDSIRWRAEARGALDRDAFEMVTKPGER